MAAIIECDAHNMEHPADWLVTRLENGESMGYCDTGYMELMQSFVEAAAQAEADQADAEAEARLAAVQAPASEPDAGPNDDPRVTTAATTIAQREIDQANVAADEAGTGSHSGIQSSSTEPAHVVRRGQSQKARQHQAAQELRAEREAAAATATAEPGDDDEDDDEDAGEGAAPPA